MKKITLILISLFAISCNCKKNSVENKAQQEVKTTLTSNCPEDGKCIVTVSKNKKIEILRDAFGKIYYEMADSELRSVIKYEYTRNALQGTQDSGYREEVIFELDNKIKDANYIDTALVNQKLLFGRFCFCRGQTGYYQITKGAINLKNSGLTVNFTTTEVPQIINSFTIDLK